MLRQILGQARDTSPGKITGRRADDPAHRPDPRGNQPAVFKMPDAQGNIDVLVGQADLAIDQHQPQGDLRLLGQEGEGDRQQVPLAEHGRSRHVQFATWGAVFTRRLPFGLLHLFKDPLRRGDIGVPRIREFDPATCSHQELGFEVPFEVSHLAADRGKWRAQAARRSREAPLLDHGQEH
jgi:hypothetical protein